MLTETPSRMEPMLLDSLSPDIANITTEVGIKATEIGHRLHPETLKGLTKLVEIMNCYYSNLIEGHPTKPRDIEAALKSGATELTAKVPGDPRRERLLKLSLAHIETQSWIDDLHKENALPNPASISFIQEVHKRFYQNLPEKFREIRDGQSPVARIMTPGQMRQNGEEVSVGDHRPPPGGDCVQSFMKRYESVYSRLRNSGPAAALTGIAAAHHRLVYIHPFDDGNGRVTRLITHAMLLDAKMGAVGLWSMSRGLARGLRKDPDNVLKILNEYYSIKPTEQYKGMLSIADQNRVNDFDGRGNLSLRRLNEFVTWFLSVALDQIKFMEKQFRLEDIQSNLINHYIPRRQLDPRLGKVLAELARQGEIPRGSVKAILGVPQRTATSLVKALTDDGIAVSRGPKGGLRLNFHIDSAEIIFPSLFGVEALLGGSDGIEVSN